MKKSFPPPDRSCSQMGGTGPTQGRLHQWWIEQAAAGGEARFVGILMESAALCKNFWGVYISDPCEPQHLHEAAELRPEFSWC